MVFKLKLGLKLRYWRRLALLVVAMVQSALIVVAALPIRQAAAFPVTQVLNTSSSPSLQTRWYSLRGYGHLNRNTDTYWPQRSDNCGGGGFKTSPWQPQYQFTYSGNDINQSSNCIDRYSDAGTSAHGGAWMQPHGDGDWSEGYQTAGWNYNPPASYSTVMGDCSTLTGGGARGIWGSGAFDGRDSSDQFYTTGYMGSMGGAVPGLYRDLYSSGTQQSINLYSNGVTLVRDHFDLTAAALAQIQQSGTQFLFQAYADDWLQVYINSVPAASSQHTTGGVTLNLATVKGALHVGTNWIGIMVADKAIFDTRDPGGRGAGVCYNMQYQYDQQPPYDLQPIVNPCILENGVCIGGSVAQVGDTINFNYAVQNNQWGASDPAGCTVYGDPHTGYYSVPAPPDKGTVQPVGTGCPRTFPGNSTTPVGGQSVVASTANQTICRSLYVNPATNGGGEKGNEACVQVAAKPYVKVFGSDVSAGNSFGAACTQSNSGVATWNKESAGGYAGAGTQYAAQALGSLLDFASAQNTSGASSPYGLSFANTTRTASIFGGSFGSLGNCLPDYYGGKPSTAIVKSAADISDLSNLGSGVFTETGDVTLSGNVNPGQDTVLYVKGNVYINNPVTYPGSWSYNKVPMFELIVQGNIYINSSVGNVDGTYIAQPNGAAGGGIYTCTTSAAPLPLSGAAYAPCSTTRLVVNGQFIASQVYLMRMKGSLNNSATNETAGSSNAGEVFNFTPANWITQPPIDSNTNTHSTGGYDAISSLPPVV
jgi:hypothetical protein